jgi:hypothetical protein
MDQMSKISTLRLIRIEIENINNMKKYLNRSFSNTINRRTNKAEKDLEKDILVNKVFEQRDQIETLKKKH